MPTALVQAAVRNGMAFVSINYRLVATKYWHSAGAAAGKVTRVVPLGFVRARALC